MKGTILLWVTLFFATCAIGRDCFKRVGVSAAIWIPTLWVGVLCSRPISVWLSGQFQERVGYERAEGTPTDMIFYLASIILALIIVVHRKLEWGAFVSRNWPIILLYFYLLVSVLWADSVLVSFKRWFKEAGNIILVMLILTEKNPRQAFSAVFVRCSYLLFPLSILFLHYFPQLGRRYNIHTGELQVIGVTDQKNSLGAMTLVCALVIIWDLLETTGTIKKNRDRIDSILKFGILFLGVYLLRLSDSKTSMVCLALGGGILVVAKLPVLRKRLSSLGLWGIGLILLFISSNAFFGIKEWLIASLGRDMTMTGRTDIWREILSMDINPLIGTGFYSFWSDPHYLFQLPQWMPFSAHNGYLEMYIDGGFFGVFLLVIFLCVTAFRVQRAMNADPIYSFVEYAALVIAIVANFSESDFARMTPIGFLFIFTAVGGFRRESVQLPGSSYNRSSVSSDSRERSAFFRTGCF